MSKRKKRTRGNPARRELRRPPNREESLDIAVKVYQVAEMVADGKTTKAVDSLWAWVPPGPVGSLHIWYLATCAPIIIMGLIRKHFPVDMEPDDLWIMEHTEDYDPDSEDAEHADAMCQVLVRYLNDDTATAQDLITAHHSTHGDEGLFLLGLQAVKCLAGVIKSVRVKNGG